MTDAIKSIERAEKFYDWSQRWERINPARTRIVRLDILRLN